MHLQWVASSSLGVKDWNSLSIGDFRSLVPSPDVQMLVSSSTSNRIAVGMGLNMTQPVHTVPADFADFAKRFVLVVLDDDPLPPSLSQEFSDRMLPLMRRYSIRDVMTIRGDELGPVGAPSSSEKQTMINWCLGRAATDRCHWITHFVTPSADVDRFPAVGPASPLVTTEVIKAVLQQCDTWCALPPMSQQCVTAGLLLLWDRLDESHQISQTMEGRGKPRTADYWHGIMHRREPDLGNAGYWFHKVGRHPAYDRLSANLLEWIEWQGTQKDELELIQGKLLRSADWDPDAMLNLCRDALRMPNSVADRAARRVQYLEIINLLAFTMHDGKNR